MNSQLTDFLDITLHKGIANELKGNRLAAMLYQLVKSRKLFLSSRNENVLSLINGIPSEDILSDGATISEYWHKFQDFRFKHLKICNIKKYPGSIADSKYYGLSFCNNDSQPISKVFLGSNGVGKTSVYAALEYGGIRKLNSASVRGYQRKIAESSDSSVSIQKDQSEFMLHSGADFKEASIQIFTQSDTIRLDGEQLKEQAGRPIITEAFYCSDYDVRQLELSDDYTQFILKQLGLNYFYHCLQDIYYLGGRVKNDEERQANSETSARNAYIEEIQARLLLGIATGGVKIKFDTFINQQELDDLFFDLIDSENEEIGLNAVRKLKDILQEEMTKIPKQNWYSSKVRDEYIKCMILLAQISKKFKRKIFPIEDADNIGIEEFLTFRNNVTFLISDIYAKLESYASDEKDKLIDESIIDYIHARENSANPLLGEQELFLFESDDQRSMFWKEYNQLLNYLESRLKDIMKRLYPTIKEIVEGILAEYFEIDNDRFQLLMNINETEQKLLSQLDTFFYSNKSTTIKKFIELKVSIMTSRGNLNSEQRFPMSPRAYLNTFKFKLFCVALKLALCCVVKKTHYVNYPLIIDDVFDSSDFDSRIRLKDFVQSMQQYHNTFVDDKNLALQLIFFTQDDLIADQVYKGLTASYTTETAKLSRIFDYHECDENPTEFMADGHVIKFKSIEDIIK